MSPHNSNRINDLREYAPPEYRPGTGQDLVRILSGTSQEPLRKIRVFRSTSEQNNQIGGQKVTPEETAKRIVLIRKAVKTLAELFRISEAEAAKVLYTK